jgi:C-terminal processing protease CtpA/Prc
MKLKSVFRLAVALCSLCASVFAQGDFEKERHKTILALVKNDVKKNYYDPNFKGIDLEAKYKAALEKIDKATSIGQLNGIIAQFLIDFDDSHLFFLPPAKNNKTEYGFDIKMIGDKSFIASLDAKSDAAKKGLQVGDQLAALDGYELTRENLWKVRYSYYSLRPKPALKLEIIKPDGKETAYEILARITTGKKVMDLTDEDIFVYEREGEDAYNRGQKQFYYDKLEGIFVWKMPSFSLEPAKVDDIMGRIKKYDSLILDLRGNGGGRVDMLLRLLGNIFPEDVKVGDEKKRKESKEVIARSRGKDAYNGKVVVLIDSGSASASEVFAKVIQYEKRGQVLGDQSAGAVMESRFFDNQTGLDTVIFFGTSITVADLIMKDGKSLEKIGVKPDLLLLPTGKNLAEKSDPVLAKAIESLGVKITPEDAGKLFPDENKK